MKIKINILTAALYIAVILFSCGILSGFCFDTHFCYGETETEAIANCSEEEIQNALHAPAVQANTITSYDTYLEAYFTNLTENFGYNYKGSCGYVAAGMLLSYFDNYYSDNIIPERYDERTDGTERNMNLRKNSPGTMNDNYLFDMYNDRGNDLAQISAQEYYNYLKDYENYSFHAKLILFANDTCGLYNFKANNKEYSCGITMNDLIRVIHLYLYYERGYDWGPDFWFKYPKSKDEDSIKQFIIDQIDAGLPVCTMIGKVNYNGTKSYHFVVAYAHDDSGNIFVHSGWHSNYYSTRETIYNLGYDFYDDAFILNFFVPEHIHSDNYAVTRGGETSYYCYCSDEIVTYKHAEHNYTCKYVNIDADTHKAYCICEDYKIQNHAYNERCKSVSAEKHYAYCKCGVGGEFEHLWKIYSDPSLSPGRYVKCSNCGFIKKLTDENVNVTLSVRKEEYL